MRTYTWIYLLGLVLALLPAATGAAPPHQSASAATRLVFLPIVTRQNAPPFSTSYYIESASPDFFRKLGCATAQELQTKGIAGGFVYLFFGQPAYTEPIPGESSGYGTLMLGDRKRFASIAEIRAAIQSWVDGYIQGYDDQRVFPCPRARLPLPRVTLSVATSNLPISITSPTFVATPLPQTTVESYTSLHGSSWAMMINNLDSYITQKNAQATITIAGGNNIELNWNTPQLTRQWVNGYNLLADSIYYNAGACEGCPQRPADARLTGWYVGAWTAEDVWSVSANLGARLVPQVYAEDGASARQWATLKQVTEPVFGPVPIEGVLTQYWACKDREKDASTDPCFQTRNLPEVGWKQQTEQLRCLGLPVDVPWSTDVRWDFALSGLPGGWE